MIATATPSILAEDITPAEFFRADRERMQRLQQAPQTRAPIVVQRPTHLIRRAAPVRGFARVVPAAKAEPDTTTLAKPTSDPAIPAEPVNPSDASAPAEAPAQSADAASPGPAPAAPVIAAPAPEVMATPPAATKPRDGSFSVLVIGDSLGLLLGQGLTETFADKPDVSIVRKARENTGLVRDDYFDWVKGARDLAASTDKISMVVMMIGSNDRQQLRDGGASVDPRQPRWQQLYGDRVEAIVKTFRDKKIPVVWVGLPIMKSERFSDDMASFNDIYQDRAVKAGAAYVDIWEAFQDDRGLYAAYGPDVNGQFQKLRSADGVHFTKAGALKLAHFVESDIRHAIEDAHPAPDPAVAAVPMEPLPAAANPVAPLPVPAAPGPIVALPAPAAPPAVVIPVKPAFGPVRPLTGPSVSPGAALVTRSVPPSGQTGPTAILERTLVQGQPQSPRPGRADDFHWPRN